MRGRPLGHPRQRVFSRTGTAYRTASASPSPTGLEPVQMDHLLTPSAHERSGRTGRDAPGTAATTFANTNAQRAMRTMDSPGTVGSGTAEIRLANSVQSYRPRAMPIATPTATDTEDCHDLECRAIASFRIRPLLSLGSWLLVGWLAVS